MDSLEAIVVGLIIAGCSFFSGWRLMSARLRLRVLDVLSGVPGLAATGWAGRLRQRVAAQISGGCGSCARNAESVRVAFPGASRKPGGPPR